MLTTALRMRMTAELMKIAWECATRRTVCGVGGEQRSDSRGRIGAMCS